MSHGDVSRGVEYPARWLWLACWAVGLMASALSHLRCLHLLSWSPHGGRQAAADVLLVAGLLFLLLDWLLRRP